MKVFSKLSFIMISISLISLVSCSNYEKDIFRKLETKWEIDTTNKILANNNFEEELFIDYSEMRETRVSLDELWRSLEIYKLIGFDYQSSLVSNINKMEPTNQRENLVFNNVCRNLGHKCDLDLDLDYNLIIKNLTNEMDNELNEKMFETLDIIYFIILFYENELNEDSKKGVINWVVNNQQHFHSNVGYLFTILYIQDKMQENFVNITNPIEYMELMDASINEKNTNLIDIYYLYFINHYLKNPLDKNIITETILEHFNKVDGFSLSKDEYVDGNLGTYLGVRILDQLGRLDIVKQDLLILSSSLESEYGVFMNKQNIPNGTIEETIMAFYTLKKLNNKQANKQGNKKLLNHYSTNKVNWFWIYFDLIQADQNIPIKDKEIIIKDLQKFEFEVMHTEFSELEIEQLLSSSGIIQEVEYFSRVGLLLDYQFNSKYKEKISLLSKELTNRITNNEIDVLSSVLSLNLMFNIEVDLEGKDHMVSQIIKENSITNFYEWYNIVKSAKLLGYINKNDIKSLFIDYINPHGGVNSNIDDESSDTLLSVFLMTSLLNEYE